MSPALQHVWRPGAIGPLSLPHRLVMGSMHLGLEGQDDDGRALAAFYRERAEGGAALIVTGGSAVSRVGAGGRNYSFVNDDAEAGKLERVAAAVHEAGALILLQLFHAGRYAFQDAFGLQPVAPSAVYSSYSRCEPRALSGDEVLETVEDFAAGARRARELGFDGVEIMGSEGYLLSQFMASVTNRREDEWGGDSERRMRFPLAVAAAVRAASGADQAVVYRISGADLVDGGATQAEVLALSGQLADGLVDALNVGIGWHEARIPTVQALVPHRAWTPWAAVVKRMVGVPVIASNRVNTAALAEEVLAAGEADYVSMARPFLADPEIVRKSRTPGDEPVNVCIACNQACIDRSVFDRRVSCVVNPRAAHELELPRAGATGAGCRVAVVGGGPAGMEAARALAVTGHDVELFEAAGRLGGQFQMARRIPGKEDFGQTIAYFEAKLPRLGVSVRLGTRVDDVAMLERFDAVVVATGVVPRTIRLAGSDLPHVVTYAELLSQEVLTTRGGSAAIIGAGGIGVDVAHLLGHHPAADPRRQFYAAHGLTPPEMEHPPARPSEAEADGERVGGPAFDSVTLMCRSPRAGRRIGPTTRWAVLQALQLAGVRTLTGVRYERIEPEGVVLGDPSGAEQLVRADTVVVAAGQESNGALAGALEAAGLPHVVIGGAASATELDAERAFREGSAVPGALSRQLIGSRA